MKNWVLEEDGTLCLEYKHRQQNVSFSELWIGFEYLDFRAMIQNCYILYLQDLTFLVHIFYQWEPSMKSSLENLFHPGMFNYLLLQQGTVDLIYFYDIAMNNQWCLCCQISVLVHKCIVGDYKVYFQRCKCGEVNLWFSTLLSGHSFVFPYSICFIGLLLSCFVLRKPNAFTYYLYSGLEIQLSVLKLPNASLVKYLFISF